MTEILALRILASIIGGLILAMAIALVRRRRLIVIAPKLYAHTQLTDRGNIVELTILNRGIRTEEDVRVNMSSACKYSLLASNSADLRLKESTMYADRIPPNDEITAIFAAEEKGFGKEEISSVTSKETKGRIADSFDQVWPSTKDILVGGGLLAGLFAVMMAVALVGPSLYKSVLGEPSLSAPARPELASFLEAEGWEVRDGFLTSEIAGFYEDNEFPLDVQVEREDWDFVLIHVRVHNKSDDILDVYADIASPARLKERTSKVNSSVYNLLVFPGEQAEEDLRAYLPATHQHQMLRGTFQFRHERSTHFVDRDFEVP